MRYTKPTIVKTEQAMAAIQSQNQYGITKPFGLFLDFDNYTCTVGAYESDE